MSAFPAYGWALPGSALTAIPAWGSASPSLPRSCSRSASRNCASPFEGSALTARLYDRTAYLYRPSM